jgi:polysaccharide deacetylase 2 family uncharacterized protein YibQ
MGYRSPRRASDRAGTSRRTIILVLAGLLVFLLALDYLGWVKGTRSPVFGLVLGRRTAPDLTEFYKIITRELVSNGVKKRSISGFMDKQNIFHVKVDLPLSLYTPMAAPLENALTSAGARILSLEASQEADTVFYLWMIQGRGKERMALLFACSPPAKGEKPAEKPAALKPPARGQESRLVALIMDDLGNSLEAAQEACGLGLPLTLSVLPFSLYATETAQLAHECGLEVALHLPMESQGNNHTEKNTPGMLYASMSAAEIRATTEQCLEQVPYIRGVNNHMGSKLTEMAAPMTAVFETMKDKNLYFIDSRTSSRSLASDLARRMGIRSAVSSLFIDPGDGTKPFEMVDIEDNLAELLSLARRHGQAIGICHPRPQTFAALKKCALLAKEAGVTLVFASRLARD